MIVAVSKSLLMQKSTNSGKIDRLISEHMRRHYKQKSGKTTETKKAST